MHGSARNQRLEDGIMPPQITQAETELQVFREFAAADERPILIETISPRDPPEPDIVCEIAGEGLIGFELTELVDSGFMAGRDLMYKTQTGLDRFSKESLPELQSERFRNQYSKAHLRFFFGANASSYRKRSALFPTIFAELLCLPDGFVGDALKFDSRCLPTLEKVKISRSQFIGPSITVSN